MEMKQVHTSCRDCQFAVYDVLPTQTGCELGRTDRYREQGCLVEAYDEECEFYVVDGRACNAFRKLGSPWLNAGEDPVARVKSEIGTKVGYVIIASAQSTPEQVVKTAKAVLTQCPPPEGIVMAHPEGLPSPGKFNAALFAALGNNVTWRMTCVLGTPFRGELVDAAVERLGRGNWYAVFNAGDEVPAGFAAKLEEALNERMEQFCAVKGDENGSGLLVQTAFHKHPMVGGNSTVEAESGGEKVVLTDVLSKALFLADSQGRPDMVREKL